MHSVAIALGISFFKIPILEVRRPLHLREYSLWFLIAQGKVVRSKHGALDQISASCSTILLKMARTARRPAALLRMSDGRMVLGSASGWVCCLLLGTCGSLAHACLHLADQLAIFSANFLLGLNLFHWSRSCICFNLGKYFQKNLQSSERFQR